jgi:hypothetical protein
MYVRARALACAAARLDVADRAYAEALSLAASCKMRPLIAYCQLGLLELGGAARDLPCRSAMLAAAMDTFTALGMDSWLRRAKSVELGAG